MGSSKMQLVRSMLARNTKATSQIQVLVDRSSRTTSQLQLMLLNLTRNLIAALHMQLVWNPMVTYLMKFMWPK